MSKAEGAEAVLIRLWIVSTAPCASLRHRVLYQGHSDAMGDDDVGWRVRSPVVSCVVSF